MSDVLLPILKDTKDPHYRYKMPKLLTKIEGSGNGIRTNIVNMTAVAKALGRPPSYPSKYFLFKMKNFFKTFQHFIHYSKIFWK